MQLILNIGLKSEELGDIPAEKAFRVVEGMFGQVFGSRIVQSDTEPTLVVDIESAGNMAGVSHVAASLGQDCVAAYAPGLKTGMLLGPRADKWGEFNPEFFLMIDGRRLSEHK